MKQLLIVFLSSFALMHATVLAQDTKSEPATQSPAKPTAKGEASTSTVAKKEEPKKDAAKKDDGKKKVKKGGC